jgi:hypothetical protein
MTAETCVGTEPLMMRRGKAVCPSDVAATTNPELNGRPMTAARSFENTSNNLRREDNR